MGAIERAIKSITELFGRLTPTHRLLLASAAIIGVLAWILVAQLSGRVTSATLAVGGTPEEIGQRVAALQSAGIAAQITPNGISVPAGREQEAMARLGEAKLLPNDTQYLFRNLIEGQTWWASREQNNRQYVLALRNELGRQINQYTGVRAAVVNLDVPEVQGLGAATRRPTASVSVQTRDGGGLSQALVDAIAAHVAGAVAGMDTASVQVIDASTGRSRKPSNGEDMLSTTYLDHATKVEKQTREKIAELLGYIPGVVVAVTAQVDVTQVTARVEKNMEKGDGTISLPRRAKTDTTNQTEKTTGAEAGLRSNVGADIDRGGGGGAVLEESKEENEFDNHVGKRTESIVDPRGMPTRLAVSVNVPRGYIASLVQKEQAAAAGAGGAAAPAPGAAPAAPSEADILKRFEDEKTRITESLKPHVKVVSAVGQATEGDVVVSMIAAEMPAIVEGGGGGLLGSIGLGGGGGGVGGLIGSGIIDKVVLAALAAVALFMMMSMVKRSTQKTDMPTAEELVGLPTKMEPVKDEAIGEAVESETAMSGIELGEDDMKVQKMLESVGEMVAQDPDTASRLLKRWVQVDS